MIAAKVKANANGATTFLQIVRARYGVPCHLLFTFYAMVCVHVVSGSLVLGAAASKAAWRTSQNLNLADLTLNSRQRPHGDASHCLLLPTARRHRRLVSSV